MTTMSEIKSNSSLSCPYAEICSGCQYLHLSYEAQQNVKMEGLRRLLAERDILAPEEIFFHSAGPGHLRDRLDFSFEDGRWGLYRKDHSEILDLETCPQLSPALLTWYQEFREISWPFKKGSVRLRVGPRGERGAWLDLANIDIKNLLEEKEILHFLQQKCFVEIGQRRKVPTWNGEQFKLTDPQLKPWFQTWIHDLAIDLYCQIASFTQPSLKANRLICDLIGGWIEQYHCDRLIEFGSGIGNLTLPALAHAKRVLACEIDVLSLEGLETTMELLPPELSYLRDRLEIHRGDFQKKLTKDFSQFDGVLVNPPRSGLMSFLDPLENLKPNQRPPFFIYMSCFPESMATDLVRLQSAGYKIKQLAIVDQFPQTTHYEVLSLLERE